MSFDPTDRCVLNTKFFFSVLSFLSYFISNFVLYACMFWKAQGGSQDYSDYMP